ncbi:MAG: hypothetical protein M1825_005368 [Sarcosagium campestre]|nr:MAG: hypothetical protein M1825_005368 [Sarcosagium campestre]
MKTFKSYFRPSNQQSVSSSSAADASTESHDSITETQTDSQGGSSRASRHRSQKFSQHGDPLGAADSDSMLQLKAEMMVGYVWQQQQKQRWSCGGRNEGVVLKKAQGSFVCAPQSLSAERDGLFDAVKSMNVRVAMTLTTKLMSVVLAGGDVDTIALADGLRVQVVQSVHHLPGCQRHQCAAFIADAQTLVVWDDDPFHLIDRASRLEGQLLKLNWLGSARIDETTAEKDQPQVTVAEIQDPSDTPDLEAKVEQRPTQILAPLMVSGTITLLITALGLGWRQLANEFMVDPRYSTQRLALVFLAPLQAFLSLFFMGVVISGVVQMIGPISQVKSNSTCYSAKRPQRLQRDRDVLPHMTIQCPVYKEGLNSVIKPTILSIKAAMSTYEMQGGSANIFINDDGMQLISDEDARLRREFYDENRIGWVARPQHSPNPENGEKAFLRRGKFKKASNMNYALMISNRVEEKLLAVERDGTWNQEKEKEAYHACLAQVLNEEEGRAWAEGDVRIGDYILLGKHPEFLIQVDSDTRVPVDCLLDAASEMEQSPEVGILQYSSGVMQVAHNFFENGITFFTNLIYTAIKYSCANGDVVPFVGHNAILRWSALQQVVYTDEDGYEKFWSESHVSEDFDMALRLQCIGYTIRFGAYTDDGFKEGVSLTVYDELARWEKYAYGCNELLFHPLRYWPMRGPFTPLFRKFITSNIRVTSKITILSYIGTYYAIGAAWVMTVANFFIIAFLQGTPYLSKYYLDSFKIWFSLICVFNALGNLSLAVYRYRVGDSPFLPALITNFKWLPLLSIFLGGISLHVSQALLCHMFSIDLTWGATAKELDSAATFAKEWKRFVTKFRGTFIFCFLLVALMIAFAFAVPPLWRFSEHTAILPLAVLVVSHFLLPVALNPSLMMLSW